MSIIIPANSAVSGGYEVDNSLRFNTASTDYLTRAASAFGTPTNRKKCTISFWCKRSSLTVQQAVMGVETTPAGGANEARLILRGDDTLELYDYQSGYKFRYITNRVFRDTSAWLHIVFSVDTTHPTGSARVNLYINGVAETSFSSTTDPAEDLDTFLNSGNYVQLGRQSTGNSYYGGYLSEYVFIDGSALAPTDFGEFDEDSGIWKPKSVSGLSFGTNGFYLEFGNSGALGTDSSGAGNTFTPVNLTSLDQSTDTCTNNFSTLNSLNSWGANVLSEGNLTITSTSATAGHTQNTIHMNKGKWYMEFNVDTHSSGSSAPMFILAGTGAYQQQQTGFSTSGDGAYGIGSNGRSITDGVESGSVVFTELVNGDKVQIAFDADAGKAWFGINDVYLGSGNPSTGANPYFTTTKLQNNDVSLTILGYDTQGKASCNFGSPPYAISSGNTDGNDHGNFEYAVPTNYLALCTKNLSEVDS